MKKLILLFVMVLGIVVTSFAETKQYKHGEVTAYLSGNRAEIVDNNNNVCIIVTIDRTKNSLGEWVYEFACGNKKTKNLTKLALKSAITFGISSVASPAGAAAISAVATSVASDIYDDVCNYYGER